MTDSETTSHSGTIGAKVSGETGIPYVAKASVTGEGALKSGKSHATAMTHTQYGLEQVVKEIANSTFVLLIDDFHYMRRSVQSEIAKEIKEAARRGVKIVTASVPHRSDDVVRSNPELRGRVRAIDSEYWKPTDLTSIAAIGFPLLNVEVDEETISEFATEAAGSPQLMQALCLQICFSLKARATAASKRNLVIDATVRREILEETSNRTDYSSLVTKCHRGPKTRGTERKEFEFSDSTRGDVYRSVLLALADDPPKSSFTYQDLSRRIARVSPAGTPQPASIFQACSQIAKIASDMSGENRVIEWDGDESILEIVDPYFLFFLRHSDHLSYLGTQ